MRRNTPTARLAFVRGFKAALNLNRLLTPAEVEQMNAAYAYHYGGRGQ